VGLQRAVTLMGVPWPDRVALTWPCVYAGG